MALHEQDPARGERLAAARKAKGLTQTQVAYQTGIDVASVSRHERGGRVSIANLKKLCELYGITAESIRVGVDA